jgi:hypothetical protein
VLICAVAILHLALDRGDAWGALAVGRAPGAGTVTVSVVGKATEGMARKRALEACRTAKNGNGAARSACEIVATIRRECFAFAGAEWAIAVDEQSARQAATAKCNGGPCRVVSGCGTAGCRTTAKIGAGGRRCSEQLAAYRRPQLPASPQQAAAAVHVKSRSGRPGYQTWPT